MNRHEEMWRDLKTHLVQEVRHPHEYSDEMGAIMQIRFILRKMEEMEEDGR